MITNYLSPLEFEVAIKRLPNVEFTTQKVELPGVSANPVDMANSFNRSFQSPDKLSYEEFNLSFIIDEKMNNYIEVFRWLKGMTDPEGNGEYAELLKGDGVFSDISVTVLNSLKNPSIEYRFINCMPINLSGIGLDTTNSDVAYPEATVSFRYDYFDIYVK